MTNTNMGTSILKKRHLVIRGVIVKLIENLGDTKIPGIDEDIKEVTRLCDEGIVKRQIISAIELIMKDKNEKIISIIRFNIDWERHTIHIKNGDESIHLDRFLTSDGNDDSKDGFSLKSVAFALADMKELITEAGKHLEWSSCTTVCYWNESATDNDLAVIDRKTRFTEITKDDLEEISKFKIETSLIPDKIDELTVIFKTNSPPKPSFRKRALDTVLKKIKSKLDPK